MNKINIGLLRAIGGKKQYKLILDKNTGRKIGEPHTFRYKAAINAPEACCCFALMDQYTKKDLPSAVNAYRIIEFKWINTETNEITIQPLSA
ncbi:hypothetical protein KAI92_04595 [Candidatus Parcubacteria bacterium]|nr:hypothetical protein [Candidatus Parcubacteria bacterium]